MKKENQLQLAYSYLDFYEVQNGQPMNENQNSFIKELIEKIWEAEIWDLKNL